MCQPQCPQYAIHASPQSWFSQEVFIIGLVLTSANFLWTLYRGILWEQEGGDCSRYVASVKTKCHNIKVVNVWEQAEHLNETFDAQAELADESFTQKEAFLRLN